MNAGYVDLQVNGCAGVSFSAPDLTREGIERVGARLGQRGIAAYCPTLVTESPAIYERNLPLLARACEAPAGPGVARILGIHLEGPFINPKDGPRGAHPLEHVQAPSINLFDRMRRWTEGHLAIVTLAPDVDGALPLIEHIVRSRAAVVSIGHHSADADTIRRACDAGARLATHVGNGLEDVIHRHHNPLWPMLAEDRLTGMFITDGHHLPADFIRVALRAKGVERFIVTSDMTALSGLPPGEYAFHGQTIVAEANGRLHLKGEYRLAGSSSDLRACAEYFASLGLLDDAGLRAVTRDNALRALNP